MDRDTNSRNKIIWIIINLLVVSKHIIYTIKKDNFTFKVYWGQLISTSTLVWPLFFHKWPKIFPLAKSDLWLLLLTTTWLKSIQEHMDRRSACCSQSLENCSSTLSNTCRCALTLVRKSGAELILNSAVFSYVRKEAPFHLSLTRWRFSQRLRKGAIKVRRFDYSRNLNAPPMGGFGWTRKCGGYRVWLKWWVFRFCLVSRIIWITSPTRAGSFGSQTILHITIYTLYIQPNIARFVLRFVCVGLYITTLEIQSSHKSYIWICSVSHSGTEQFACKKILFFQPKPVTKVYLI